jgi:intracellular growth IglE-like protein
VDAIRTALILAVVTTAGCLSSATTCTLVVHPRRQANQGRRFFLVVRALQGQEFITDGYQRIADLVFPAAPPDPSVKLVRLVLPGRDDTVKITLHENQPLGVYALFTEPGESWKTMVEAPLKARYDVVVDGNRVAVKVPSSGALEPAKKPQGATATAPSGNAPNVNAPNAAKPSGTNARQAKKVGRLRK